jgi:hypothetical protein
MRVTAILLLSLALAAQPGLAEDPKPAAKKPAKNVFQKTESSVGEFAHKHKIWTRSEPRGTAQKKPAKKAD